MKFRSSFVSNSSSQSFMVNKNKYKINPKKYFGGDCDDFAI